MTTPLRASLSQSPLTGAFFPPLPSGGTCQNTYAQALSNQGIQHGSTTRSPIQATSPALTTSAQTTTPSSWTQNLRASGIDSLTKFDQELVHLMPAEMSAHKLSFLDSIKLDASQVASPNKFSKLLIAEKACFKAISMKQSVPLGGRPGAYAREADDDSQNDSMQVNALRAAGQKFTSSKPKCSKCAFVDKSVSVLSSKEDCYVARDALREQNMNDVLCRLAAFETQE